MLQSTTTPGEIDMWRNADIPRADILPQLNLVLWSTTTPDQLDMGKNTDIPRADVPPLIKPSATEHYYSLTCGRMQMYPGQTYHPANQT